MPFGVAGRLSTTSRATRLLLGMGGAGLLLALGSSGAALGQGAPPAPPPAVGVIKATRQPITQTNEFIGRVQAINRVDVVARVTAFVDKVAFKDGAEVKKGDVLYQLERGPFEADLGAKKAVEQQYEAQIQNANVALERAQTLLKSQAGAQATVDSALAAQKALAAQVLGAQASVKTSDINLGYTMIVSPIDGKIGRTAITPGNVVSPGSGVLTTIVSQDPMYVVFPASVRTLLDLRTRYTGKGFDAVVIKIKLPDGRDYAQTGKLTFVDNTVQTGTDTITLRGTIANPLLKGNAPGESLRELSDNEFVTVYLEGAEPIQVLAVPRAAVLSDQQGDYVYTVDAANKAHRSNVKLGQSTPTVASVISGLNEGDTVIAEGLQRVRPDQPVSPAPVSGPPAPTTQSATSPSVR